MFEAQFEIALKYFKALADENRLRIIALLAEDEHRVSELAAQLGLTEPTISHHIGKLRELGLVNIRVAGTSHYYRLNLAPIHDIKAYLAHFETDPAKAAYHDKVLNQLETLDLSDEDRQIVRGYLAEGRIKAIPTKHKKLLALLHWTVCFFEPNRRYTEQEVNHVLMNFHDDYVFFRRALIDYGFMERERDGSVYWLATTEG